MRGNNFGSPRRIMDGGALYLLLRMDANPVIRHDKRAECVVGHMTSDAARAAVQWADGGMIRDCVAVASQTSLFGFGGERSARGVGMRIVTVGTREIAPALAPALG